MLARHVGQRTITLGRRRIPVGSLEIAEQALQGIGTRQSNTDAIAPLCMRVAEQIVIVADVHRRHHTGAAAAEKRQTGRSRSAAPGRSGQRSRPRVSKR